VSVLSVQQSELLLPTVPTACGSAPMHAAMRCWPAAQPSPFENSEFGDTTSRSRPADSPSSPRRAPIRAEVLIEPPGASGSTCARANLQWTDGRLAQMLIGHRHHRTRNAENLAANQAERPR